MSAFFGVALSIHQSIGSYAQGLWLSGTVEQYVVGQVRAVIGEVGRRGALQYLYIVASTTVPKI